jgi:YfiR/HmsC-like
MASLTRVLAVALLLVLRMSCAMASEARDYPEASVKAVYLYRFPGYVEWPEEVRSRPRFTIAVLSNDGVAEALARVLPAHPIGNRPAELRIAHSADELIDAQVAYIGSDYRGDLPALIAKLAQRPVLIVTEQENALAAGSMINFLLLDRRVRFEVAPGSAARAGLKISSQLLAVAVRVQP